MSVDVSPLSRSIAMPRVNLRSLYLLLIGLVCLGAVGYVVQQEFGGEHAAAQVRAVERLEQIPFDGKQAYAYLKQVCDIGPRVSGTPGMTQQQKLLTEHFQKLGATVTRQEFQVRHPIEGTPVAMANLIVTWHPDRKQRYVLCAHYDTRPFPDRDTTNPRGVFVGANDGGSGVAVLMELGRHMPTLAGKYGVDFVLFDGEELVYRENTDEYFLGSKHFARQHVAAPAGIQYRGGVLLDMVGDANLRILMEPQSMKFAGRQAGELWQRAERLGVRDFVRQLGTPVNDDHIPLNEIAKIPTFDVIDFDYPHWHTTRDVPENCSALSLAKVGWVVLEYLKLAVR